MILSSCFSFSQATLDEVEESYPRLDLLNNETVNYYFYWHKMWTEDSVNCSDIYNYDTLEFINITYTNLVSFRILMLDTTQPYEGQDIISDLFSSNDNFLVLDEFFISGMINSYTAVILEYDKSASIPLNMYKVYLGGSKRIIKKYDYSINEMRKFKNYSSKLVNKSRMIPFNEFLQENYSIYHSLLSPSYCHFSQYFVKERYVKKLKDLIGGIF